MSAKFINFRLVKWSKKLLSWLVLILILNSQVSQGVIYVYDLDLKIQLPYSHFLFVDRDQESSEKPTEPPPPITPPLLIIKNLGVSVIMPSKKLKVFIAPPISSYKKIDSKIQSLKDFLEKKKYEVLSTDENGLDINDFKHDYKKLEKIIEKADFFVQVLDGKPDQGFSESHYKIAYNKRIKTFLWFPRDFDESLVDNCWFVNVPSLIKNLNIVGFRNTLDMELKKIKDRSFQENELHKRVYFIFHEGQPNKIKLYNALKKLLDAEFREYIFLCCDGEDDHVMGDNRIDQIRNLIKYMNYRNELDVIYDEFVNKYRPIIENDQNFMSSKSFSKGIEFFLDVRNITILN